MTDPLASLRAARGPFPQPSARAFWQRVIARRHEWDASSEDSMEQWPASDRAAWLGRLEDTLTTVRESVEGDPAAEEADPLEALVDLCAVASAWADRMG